MSDLIERLEEAAQWDDSPSSLIHEAIARIAALEAQLADRVNVSNGESLADEYRRLVSEYNEPDTDGTRDEAWNLIADFAIANYGTILSALEATPPAPIASMLSNLLAVIHRDGGHYEAEHGTDKACADAETVVARLHATPPAPKVTEAPKIDDAVAGLFVDAWAEAEKAMRKFPQPNYVISKVAEEAGEVVKAAIHCAEGRETAANVVAEIKQAMAMLIRLYVEGDQVHGLPPLTAAQEAGKP